MTYWFCSHVVFSFQLPAFSNVRDLFVLFAIGLLLLVLRLFLMGCEPPEFAPADNPSSESDSLLARSLTFWYLPCLNFALMLCPILLSFDWSMDAVPLIDSFVDPRNLASLLFYALLSACVIHVVAFLNDPKPHFKCLHGNGDLRDNKRHLHDNRNLHDKRNRPDIKAAISSSSLYLSKSLVTNDGAGVLSLAQLRERNSRLQCFSFGLVLLIIPFIPATNLFFYVGFVIAERILYIPSMGFCLLVAQGFCCLLTRCRDLLRGKIYRRVLWFFFAFSIVSYSWRTVQRNANWKTEESLYRSGLHVNPAKGRKGILVLNAMKNLLFSWPMLSLEEEKEEQTLVNVGYHVLLDVCSMFYWSVM